jgi:hypothetical protein
VGSLEFTYTLVKRGPAAAVVLDDQQVAAIGEGAKRFPVRATINGHTWRTTVTPMRGEFLLGLSGAVRETAGAEVGDTVSVAVALDSSPRDVELPEVLAQALEGDPTAKAKFDSLAYTYRKEYARRIAEAKREETRQRRLEQILAELRSA